MRIRKFNLIVILLLSALSVSAYAGIIYNGNEYTETDMPFEQNGNGEFYFVVAGSIDNVSSWGLSALTVNDVDYMNQYSSSMPTAIEGKYYIYYNSSQTWGHFEINGSNDWSSSDPYDTTAITLPFSKIGAGRFTFSTDEKIASVTSSDMDTLLINEVDYTNQTFSAMPPKIDGHYYIYYSASLESAELALEKGFDTTAITMPYEYDGPGEFYVKTNGTLTSIGSNNTESVIVNDVSYTNSWSSAMPDRIDGYYYIYYRASVDWAHMEIAGDNTPVVENDTINVPLPYRYDGTGKHYFATPGTITSILSSNTDLVSINGVDITNTNALSMPSRVDGWYYIYYNSSKTWAYLEIEGDTIPVVENDTIKIDVMPFEFTGAGKHYFKTNGTITSIQSNGADSVSVNDTVITNIYTTSIPDRINGFYYIYYTASLSYASLTVAGDTTPVAPPDTTEIGLPFTKEGPDERYYAVSDNVAFMNSWGMDILTVNGVDFTNTTNIMESMLPSRINGYYYIYYRSNKTWAEFSITGSVKIYVDADPEDGFWPDYYENLGNALNNVVNGQEIWVARGTYYPDNLRTDSFNLKAGVKVYGGFKGGETTLGQRDIYANSTILSGDIGVEGDMSDNCYHVLGANASMTTANTLLDGFVIRDGYADDGSGGAGILLQNGASPLIKNCILKNNVSTANGGAIAFGGTATAPRIEFCLFDGNSAANGGVAYLNTSARSLTLHRVTFVNNSASLGGAAIYAGDAATVVIDSCILWKNTVGGEMQFLVSDLANVTTTYSASDDVSLQGITNAITYYSSEQADGPFQNLIAYILDTEHGISLDYGYRRGIYDFILNIRLLLQGAL